MKTYIGTKVVYAKTMSRLEYNNYRGWNLPFDENGEDEGLLVEYVEGGKSNHPKHAGYISWSPKDVFEKSYKPNGLLTFGQAIELLKEGKLVTRKGWNGKGMFLFIRPADKLPVEMIVNTVKSLPKELKDYVSNQFKEDYKKSSDGSNFTIEFTSYICMKAADGTIVNGWLASQTDMLAEDWQLFEPEKV